MPRWSIIPGLFALLLLPGCVQTRITESKRSAVEQLLLSTAADEAVSRANLDFVNGRKVWFEEKYFEAEDKQYVLGTIRDALSSHGALFANALTNADLVVEARSGALSTDSSSSLVGIPSMPLPIPFAGTFVTPELSLFKSQKQFSVSKVALLSYERDSGKHVNSSGPLDGYAHHHYYTILSYVKFTSTSIPEKKRKPRGKPSERAAAASETAPNETQKP
jgi:hypothetical protein